MNSTVEVEFKDHDMLFISDDSTISDLSSITDITIDESFDSMVESESDDNYDKYSLSRQQIEAGLKIINAFINNPNGTRWIILLAQMQSGKTETYLFVCSELIRRNVVKSVVIFSGNSETDLKEQLLKEVEGARDAKFYDKYDMYLEEKEKIQNRIRRDILKKVKDNIQVLWGPELKKCSNNYTDTLFVWEESHFAQNIHQCPDKFLTNAGIAANGDCDTLREKRNYVISVSATPFSENSDLVHLKQNKEVVHMKPGIGYNSVKNISDNGRLRSFKNVEAGLTKALTNNYSGKKYGIVRITSKNEETVIKIIQRNRWIPVIFDSLATGEVKETGIKTWNGMNNAPQHNTVILLRGKCRMGKNLEKKHIAFVMETAKNSKTDTILQGLLGRVCGYSEGSTEIDVYLHEKIIKSEEINRYIDFINGKKNMPLKARNLVKERVSYTRPIIPIKITRDLIRFPANDRTDILKDINDAFNTNTRIQNGNQIQDFNEVSEKFIQSYRGNKKNLNIGYLDKNYKTCNQVLADKLKDAFNTNAAVYFGSGCGFDAEGLEINIWTPKNIDNFAVDEIYITAVVKVSEESRFRIPLTTKREVFAHCLEDGTEVVGNGAFIIPLDYMSSFDISVMLSELKDFINMSNVRQGCARQVSSCYVDEKDKLFKGILVTLPVLRALEPGGSIQTEILQTYGLMLHIVNSNESLENGFIRLASISW